MPILFYASACSHNHAHTRSVRTCVLRIRARHVLLRLHHWSRAHTRTHTHTDTHTYVHTQTSTQGRTVFVYTSELRRHKTYAHTRSYLFMSVLCHYTTLPSKRQGAHAHRHAHRMHTRADLHPHTHTRAHTHEQTTKQTNKQSNIPGHTYTRTHIHTHTQARTYARTAREAQAGRVYTNLVVYTRMWL